MTSDTYSGVKNWTKKVHTYIHYILQYFANTEFQHIPAWSETSITKHFRTQVNIFDCEMVIVPIHLGAHWATVVIDIKGREIVYYDSLLYEGTHCLNTIYGMLFITSTILAYNNENILLGLYMVEHSVSRV